MFEYYAGATNKVGGQTIPAAAPGVLLSFREPVGVCGIIVPWNFPIAITSWKSAPALAMGNTVVLKPAEQTPLTALRLAELALEAGIPEGVFTVVTGSGSVVGEALVKHPLVRKIAFTGSTEVGMNVMRLAADDIKRVSLELGGKSPNLIFDDCGLRPAVASAASSSLGNAGQDCCARSRILVQQSIYDRFSKALVEKFERDQGRRSARRRDGDGPARHDRASRAGDAVHRAAASREGATLACGGDAREERGSYLEPTVFLDAKPDMTIVREEIFGPVVAVMPFARRGGGDRAGQRLAVRPLRLDLDARHRPRAARRARRARPAISRSTPAAASTSKLRSAASNAAASDASSGCRRSTITRSGRRCIST